MGTQRRLVLERCRFLVGSEQVADRAVFLPRHLRSALDERQVGGKDELLQVHVVEVLECEILGYVELVDDAAEELLLQEELEVLGRVDGGGLLHVGSSGELVGDSVVEDTIARVEVGAEPGVDLFDDDRQRLPRRGRAVARAGEDRCDFAFGCVERHRPVEHLLQAQVGEFHLGAEVEPPLPLGGWNKRRQGFAEQVVAFELGVGERDDLREEGVDASEPVQGVAEPVAFVFVEER